MDHALTLDKDVEGVRNWSPIHRQCSDHAPDLFALPGGAFQPVKWFREVREAWISLYLCQSIVKMILNISSFQVFEQPLQ